MILSAILSYVVQLLNFVLLMSFICPDNEVEIVNVLDKW